MKRETARMDDRCYKTVRTYSRLLQEFGAAACCQNSILSSFSYFHWDSVPLSNYAIEFRSIFRLTRKRDSAHEIGYVMEKSRNPK